MLKCGIVVQAARLQHNRIHQVNLLLALCILHGGSDDLQTQSHEVLSYLPCRALGVAAIASIEAAPLTMNTGGAIWKDTEGRQINAHGGCILKVGKTFYWYGENQTRHGKSSGVNCYVSPDLVNWTFKNRVLSQGTPGLSESQFERPKVLYNAGTRKYVMWAHRENLRDYADAQAVVTQCDTPDGNYALVKMFRPFDKTANIVDHGKPGFMSRDCTLFQDDDGTAWFISSSNENQDLMFYKLSPDYLDTVEHSTRCFRGDLASAGVAEV